MVSSNREAESFDMKLAIECATAFSQSTKLGCTVSGLNGEILYEIGYGCKSCAICSMTGRDSSGCIQAHNYGMIEAERFGGKYIYFCPMGLTCFVSPILGEEGSEAKITVGPFLMVELEDYIDFDLKQELALPMDTILRLMPVLKSIQYIPAAQVNSLSILLFMTVGFMNNISAANKMLETQSSDILQGQISEYVSQIKGGEDLPQYPFEAERELLASIAESDKPEAQRLLNELLGHILFSSGGDFAHIKTRIYELLVVISRATIDAGGAPDQTFQLNHEFFLRAQSAQNIEQLCVLLTGVVNRLIDGIFVLTDVKHVDVIHKTVQYMKRNYAQKVTLDDVAQMVYLSPSYLSKVFKREMGCNFNTYLNQLRIENSKKLLLHGDVRLVDIATMVGFEDQSYFTKVFKRVTGVSPNRYRESGGRLDNGIRLDRLKKDATADLDRLKTKMQSKKLQNNKHYGGNDMEILQEISAQLQKGKAKDVVALVQQAVEQGISAQEILENGLLDGMGIIGGKFKNNEVFVPEVLVAARAMNQGAAVLKPLLAEEGVESKGKVVLGTVKGDLHDIGKNLVKMMMEGKGLEVIDLGIDVPSEKFIETAVAENCQVICCSALLTTTMDMLKDIVEKAEKAGVQGKIPIMIGGAPVTQSFCEQIGADCYTPDAASAAEAAVKFCVA